MSRKTMVRLDDKAWVGFLRTDDQVKQLADLSLEAKALGGHFLGEGREGREGGMGKKIERD